MRIIRPVELLDLNEEVDVIHLLEEEEYQILLSHKKLYLTLVRVTDDELDDMQELGLLKGFPKFAPQEELSIYGSIIVPSGTMEEAKEIVKKRQFDERVLGVLTQLGTPMPPINNN